MTRYREFNDRLLVVASHNPGKVREFRDLLANFDVELRAAADLALPEPAETGTSFRENAELKARVAAQTSGLAALADDSGLVVPDLDGDPGIFSARWAGPDKDFDLAMRRVHDELAARGMPDMTKCSAYFACVLSLAWPDGKIESFEGRVYGSLTWPPRGTLGFGYDPMFVAEGYDRTFGEIEPALKHTISHRADAFRQMVRACFNEVRSMSENRC